MDILIFNAGNFAGTKWCVESIKTHCAKSKIHLLDFPDFESVGNDCTQAQELAEVYDHQSPNPPGWQLGALQRWMVMYDYCRANHIDSLFTLDSDVLMFADVDTIPLPMELGREVIGFPGTALFLNLHPLRGFCDYILRLYRERGADYQKMLADYQARKLASVTDMEIWSYYFAQGQTDAPSQTITKRGYFSSSECGDACFDENICVSENLIRDNTRKLIWFMGGKPYSMRKDGRAVRLYNLHCWNKYRGRMAEIWDLSLQSTRTLNPIPFKHETQGEAGKARDRRVLEGFFDRFIQGRGIDIGCGEDPLNEDCERWDYSLGHTDATYMAGVPDALYDYVHASHILEHLDEPVTAVKNWWRVLKPGGALIISVPHRDLYEKRKTLPSRWNSEHKRFWLMEDLRLISHAALGPDFEPAFHSLRTIDFGHTIIDPEMHSDGEYSIEIILLKSHV